MEEKCFNHPLKNAVTRCKTCHKPLCMDCRVITDLGTFCSDQCVQRAKAFQEQVSQQKVKIRRKLFFIQKGFFKSLAVLLVLLVILYLVMYFIYDTRTPGDIISQFQKWFSTFF